MPTYLDACVCVAQLWVVCHDICTSIVTTSELQAQRLGQVDLQQQVTVGVCGCCPTSRGEG
jgi:hypothetical protein